MPDFPFFHAYDPETRRLTLRGATHIPPEAITFARENSVRIFDASDGQLTALPDSFGDLDALDTAFFTNNPFRVFPAVLGECARLHIVSFKGCAIEYIPSRALPPQLRWLMMTGNRLTRLPDTIGDCHALEKLALAGNRLEALPQTLQDCKRLGLVRVSANALAAEPEWLLDMPRLGWYSDAGNPFSIKPEIQALESVAWSDLTLDDKLGESPSSEVHRARLPDGRVVAAKLFRGALTSDGYPDDDLRASLHAGAHDHMMQIVAQVSDAPDGRQGLLLDLVPPTYTRPGMPPDFITCTRDSFAPGISFNLPFIVRVLRGVSGAARHMQARGLMHGDIYAHNILAHPDGHALLGDFGAASFYGNDGQKRESVDVRGFGCLVDDLLMRADKEAFSDPAFRVLQDLAVWCLGTRPAVRPSFADISDLLTSATRHVPPPPQRLQ